MNVELALFPVLLVLSGVLPVGCNAVEPIIDLSGPSSAGARLTKPDDPRLILPEPQGEKPIRVIVTLKFETGVKSSPREITKLQDRLLRTLYRHNVQVVRKFRSLPMVALVVDRPTYKMLALLPMVKSVDIDALNRPMETATERPARE